MRIHTNGTTEPEDQVDDEDSDQEEEEPLLFCKEGFTPIENVYMHRGMILKSSAVIHHMALPQGC